MLSSDSHAQELMFDYAVPVSEPSIKEAADPHNFVYTVPTALSMLQKDMSETMVQIFSKFLAAELLLKRQQHSINHLLASWENGDAAGEDAQHQRARVFSLIYGELMTICMHPSLVVDHFISKGLLLLSTKEKLALLSGKITFFDKLVNFIVERYDTQCPEADYNLLVVAESNKELELVEGLILGKKLRYSNHSSGKRLHEEASHKRMVKEDSVEEEQTFKQRHQHFTARQSGKNEPLRGEVVLHLIASNHLCLSFSSDTKFNLIVSFDMNLDLTAPGLQYLRIPPTMPTQVHNPLTQVVPILIPVPLYSVEHILRLIAPPERDAGLLSSRAETDWQVKVINAFVANRHKAYELEASSLLRDVYGANLRHLWGWVFDWSAMPAPDALKAITKYSDVDMSPSVETLKRRLNDNHLTKLDALYTDEGLDLVHPKLEKFSELLNVDYTSLKRVFAQFLNARIIQIETLVAKALAVTIQQFRENEARRQQEIDLGEETVGEQYRKLRKLNEDLAVVDRKFTRLEGENEKLQESFNEIQDMYKNLESMLETKTEEELAQMMEQQNEVYTQLETERESLKQQIDSVVLESDTVREAYQQKSSEAVQLSDELARLEKRKEDLNSKITGPGILVLPPLVRREENSVYETQLRRLQTQNAFMDGMFSQKLDKVVKERSSLMEVSASGSSSRPSNRISRASTPF